MKGPLIWEKGWCSQVWAQQNHWLFMLDTLKQCRKPAGPFSGLCVGSPRPQLRQRIEAPARPLHNQKEDLSLFSHVLLCTYAGTHVVHVIYATKREVKHAKKPRWGKTGLFIGLLRLFNNPLIRLFVSLLVIKGVYCDWSIGNKPLSSVLSGDACLLWHPNLFLPCLIWIIMDTIFLLGNDGIKPFLGSVQKPIKAAFHCGGKLCGTYHWWPWCVL